MTTYRLFSATNGPTTPQTYGNGSPFISGVLFTVTSGGNWFEGYWWWVCPTGQSTAPVKCALWSSFYNGAVTGTVVPGSVVTSGVLTAGEWNYIPLPTPVQISIGDTLVAAIGCNGSFPDSVNWWAANAPHGVTNGPLFGFGLGQNQGGSSLYNGGYGEPNNISQGCFSTGGSDPSTTIPLTQSGSDNFWVDVQVSDTAPSNYSGTFRLWPNKGGPDALGQTDDNQDYAIGTEVRLSTACQLQNIWFYSPQGAVNLPTSADVWSVSGGGLVGTNVLSNPAPAWKLPGGASATAGQGWIYTAMPANTLPAGTYRFSVYNANGTAGTWGPKRLGYWSLETGEAAGALIAPAGITNGPLYAPDTAHASLCFSYSPASGNPTEPGQAPFSVGPPNEFPNLYVGVNSTAGNLGQCYFIDPEVTLVVVLPAVTGVAPNTGLTAGGTAVTITGTGFTGATGVSFGGTPGTNMSVLSDTTISVTSPAVSAAGVVDVLVTTPSGTSPAVSADSFTYSLPVQPSGAGGNSFSGSGSGVQSYPLVPYDPFGLQTQTATAGTAPLPEPEPFSEGETQSMSNVSYLRLILQEVIPQGGSDSDTLFLDQHIVEILNRSSNVLSYAAWTGWMIKAGALAVLTDRSDGLAQKKLSQAAVAAQNQANKWQDVALRDVASFARSVAPSSVIFRPYDRGWDDIWNQVWDVSHIDRFYLPWNVIEG